MKASEFSLEFDILYNNIMSDMAPGLNAYEKSVFLTQAQEALILQIYKGDGLNESFESDEKNRRYLSILSKETSPALINEERRNSYTYSTYSLPEDHLFTTHEYVESGANKCSSDGVNVVPTRLDELNHHLRNPFRGIKANNILRLDKEGGITLISNSHIEKYIIHYLRKPYPIILEDLEDEGVSIDGKTKPLSDKEVSELPDILHRQIIIQAVQMAKLVWKN